MNCPYCQSTRIRENDERYHCLDCDCLFDEDDIVRERIRHGVSHLLIDTDEDNQAVCDIRILHEDGHTLHIDRCYQIPGDGTIWLHVSNGEQDYINFDDVSTEGLETLLSELTKVKRAPARYVVVKENTLGYTFDPDDKKFQRVNVLAVQYLKGGNPFLLNQQILARHEELRPATDRDFEEFRIRKPNN